MSRLNFAGRYRALPVIRTIATLIEERAQTDDMGCGHSDFTGLVGRAVSPVLTQTSGPCYTSLDSFCCNALESIPPALQVSKAPSLRPEVLPERT